MNRIIILGSTGFLGKSLRRKLSEEKFNVKYMIHKKKIKLKNDEFFGDILNKKNLIQNLKDGDIVINLIGQLEKDFLIFFDTNLKGSLNLLETAKLKKNIKIIFASSINVYGENSDQPSKETDEPKPMSEYGIIKFLTEELYHKYSKLYGLDITILRFSNLYGENKKNGIISNILKSTIEKPVLLTQNGIQERDFVYVDDAVNSIIQTIKIQPTKFEIFNISSGTKITPKKLIQIMEKISKKKISYKLINQKHGEKCIFADYSKANKFLNFKPSINIINGLYMILNAKKQNNVKKYFTMR